MDAQTRQMLAQAKMQKDQADAQLNSVKVGADVAKVRNEISYADNELHSKAADRASKERIQLVDLAQNLAVHPESAPLVAPLIEPALREIDEQEQMSKPSGVMPPTIRR